jgi:hypothetical protein
MANNFWSTKGYQILCDDRPRWLKGFCYSPVPIGGSFAWEPYGDFFIRYWQNIYARDLNQMRDMGVNSLRLYTTKPYVTPDDPESGPVDHTDFLNTAFGLGINIWAVYPINNSAFGNTALMGTTEAGTKLMCQEMANHPAVTGFIIGNELNSQANIDNSAWWTWMNKLGGIAKEAAPHKLTMQCFSDDGMASPQAAREPTKGNGMNSIDVFGINAYRGKYSFDGLFEQYKGVCTKPLLITEFGCPASKHDPDEPYPAGKPVELPDRANAQQDYIAAKWKEIVAHNANAPVGAALVCAGGYVFGWCDEWWKQQGPVYEHKGSTARAATFPGGWHDEEWFGINAVAVDNRSPKDPNPNKPDKLTPRSAYDYLKDAWKS